MVVLELVDQLHGFLCLPKCLAGQGERSLLPLAVFAEVGVSLLTCRGSSAMQADGRGNTRQGIPAGGAKGVICRFAAKFAGAGKKPAEHERAGKISGGGQ